MWLKFSVNGDIIKSFQETGHLCALYVSIIRLLYNVILLIKLNKEHIHCQ